MNLYTEAVLIDLAVRNNDQHAFGELVKRNQSSVRNSLRQLSNWNEALADDLAQETFIQAFKGLHKFNQRAKFASWLYRIAYNQFLQHCRTNQAQKNFAEFDVLDDHALEGSENSQESNKGADELLEKVASLLAELEPERRSVLHLLLHRQFTQQEIATTMDIPLGTVKTHITRGRAILQQQLAHYRN